MSRKTKQELFTVRDKSLFPDLFPDLGSVARTKKGLFTVRSTAGQVVAVSTDVLSAMAAMKDRGRGFEVWKDNVKLAWIGAALGGKWL